MPRKVLETVRARVQLYRRKGVQFEAMWLLVETRSVLTRKQQDWKWLNTQTSLGCSLLSKCHTASRCAYTCNFIYVHRKVRPFAVPICINLTHDQQHYLHIAYTQFHHKVDSNMERTDWKLFVPPKWTTIFISLILKSLCAFSVPNFIQIWRKKTNKQNWQRFIDGFM